MIAPLRRAHLRLWIVVAIVNAIILAAALVARRPSIVPNPAVRWEQSR